MHQRPRNAREVARCTNQGFTTEDMRERGEIGLEDGGGEQERSSGPKGFDRGAAEVLRDDGESDA